MRPLLGPEVVDDLVRADILQGAPVILAGAVLLLEGLTGAGLAQVVVFQGDVLVLSSM